MIFFFSLPRPRASPLAKRMRWIQQQMERWEKLLTKKDLWWAGTHEWSYPKERELARIEKNVHRKAKAHKIRWCVRHPRGGWCHFQGQLIRSNWGRELVCKLITIADNTAAEEERRHTKFRKEEWHKWASDSLENGGKKAHRWTKPVREPVIYASMDPGTDVGKAS